MMKKTMTIQLQSGLEARPVALLVQVASQHECSIYVEADNKKVNAKSIMGILSLSIDRNLTLVIHEKTEGEAIKIREVMKENGFLVEED